MRCVGSLLILVLATGQAPAQTGRRALAAASERYLLADYHRAMPLLVRGLDPKAGPLDGPWVQGVERLADVLLVLRQDSLAETWLRWAARLDPDFDVDADVVPPAVVRAATAARAFVDATPHDRVVAQTTFEWPAVIRSEALGSVRLAAANVPITARVGPDQFLRGGEARRLPTGSYDVVASAPGYLPTRLTVEVLPGVTTVVAVSLLPETAGLLYVAARPWGTLLIDGERIGYTGIAAHRVTPGRHVLRLQRDHGGTTDTTIEVAERQRVHLSWIATRDTTGDSRIDAALARLDAGEIERGVETLQELVTGPPVSLPNAMRTVALARLAEATWALGARDSTRALLRELVRVDPFYTAPAGLFNPALEEAYLQVRRQTPAIGLRVPRDTVVAPLRDTWPVEIAVGRPGEVRLFLRLTTPRPRDSLLIAISVESVATAKIPLMRSDSTVLAPGNYAIDGEIGSSTGSARALLQLALERMPVDTAPHAAQPSLRPETKKRSASSRTILEGLGLGVVAAMIPVAVNDASVSGRSIPLPAGIIGGSVALADIALNRPSTPIPDNIAYNDALRAQWEERNRSIAAQNAATVRLAPLRLRAVVQP